MTTPLKYKWPSVRLGDVAEFRNGVNYSKANFGKGVKVIGVSDFQDNVKASFDELEEINPAGVVRKEHYLKDGDILFVRSNGNRDLIGRNMFVENPPEEVTHSAFSIRLRFVCRDCIPRFYAYLLRSPLFRQSLSLHGGGTNISNLNQDILGRLQVPLPPRPIQYQIALILSAYDDLIENNTRRIKILEEMAQMIYREWFVNFRFPGYEKVKFVKSEMGSIPSTWPLRRIADVVQFEYGKALKSEDRKAGTIPVYGSSGVVGLHSQKLVAGPVIIVGRKGNVGSVFLSESDCWVIDTAYFVRPSLSIYFLYFNFLTQNFLNNDAAVPGLNRNQAHSLPIVVPDQKLLDEFDSLILPMFQMKSCCIKRNELLRQTRGLLLPKLISGEVSVEHLEAESANQIS